MRAILQADNNSADALKAHLDALHDFLHPAAPANLGDDAFWAEQADLLLVDNPHEQAIQPPHPAAGAAVDGQEGMHNQPIQGLPLPPPPPPPAADLGEVPGGAAAAMHHVIASHADGAPALAVAAEARSLRTTQILHSICESGSVTRRLLLGLIAAIADAGEPANVGTSSAPLRQFLFDDANLAVAGAGVAQFQTPAEQSAFVWLDPQYEFRAWRGPKAIAASSTPTAFYSELSFQADVPVGQSDAGRCLILNAAAMERYTHVCNWNQLPDNGILAICHLAKDIMELPRSSVRHNRTLMGIFSDAYELPDAAFTHLSTKDIKKALISAISNVTQAAQVTSRSRRSRLVGFGISLLMAAQNVATETWPAVERALPPHTQGDACHQAAEDTVWQAWAAAFVCEGRLGVRTDQTELNRTVALALMKALASTTQQPLLQAPTAEPASGQAGRTQPAIGLGISTSPHYACVYCGKNNHHLADCAKLAGAVKSGRPKWLQGQFELHRMRLANGMETFRGAPKGAPALPSGVDDSFDVFARRFGQAFGLAAITNKPKASTAAAAPLDPASA